jgi:hypothetical protein
VTISYLAKAVEGASALPADTPDGLNNARFDGSLPFWTDEAACTNSVVVLKKQRCSHLVFDRFFCALSSVLFGRLGRKLYPPSDFASILFFSFCVLSASGGHFLC